MRKFLKMSTIAQAWDFLTRDLLLTEAKSLIKDELSLIRNERVIEIALS